MLYSIHHIWNECVLLLKAATFVPIRPKSHVCFLRIPEKAATYLICVIQRLQSDTWLCVCALRASPSALSLLLTLLVLICPLSSKCLHWIFRPNCVDMSSVKKKDLKHLFVSQLLITTSCHAGLVFSSSEQRFHQWQTVKL